MHMEDKLRETVVGQDHVLEAIANCVRLGRTQLRDSDRPQGVFMFLGPTGTGKTLLTKALCEFLFDDEGAMTRIDMSEYMEKFSVSRLIGAPPGYVGYEEGGVLTEAVRRKPYQVVLLDEFEKAHPDVWNLMLQVFDDGHLTDSHGRRVDFRNTIIVMTANIGSEVIANLPEGADISEAKEHVMAKVRSTLSPELINRIDEHAVFNRLQVDDVRKILDIKVAEVQQRLEENHSIELSISEEAKDELIQLGYDVRYGARPLQRVIQHNLLHPLSKLILDGSVGKGDHVRMGSNLKLSRI